MIFILSCGEDSEDPIRLQPEGATGTLAAMKVPTQAAPAAPQMLVPAGTPTVKSVGYYSDWKLTKPVKGGVPAGKTLFIKVEFSEGMKLVVADDKTARPILYRRIAGKLTRFRIANFGAKGEDFVSGDAKPIQTKATYLCKYVVQPEDRGEFVFAVGKWSIDLQGNRLPAFYTHKEKLLLGKPPIEEQVGTSPVDPITHYVNGFATGVLLPLSAWVLDFPGSFRRYAPPESGPRDFVGQVCMPVAGDAYNDWAEADSVAPISDATVTITKGPRTGENVITDEGGYYLFRDVAGDNLYLRVEREYLELKEVIVYRSRPTELQERGPNRVFDARYHERGRPKNASGVIQVGIRWPDAVRFILEEELLPHDLLCTIGIKSPNPKELGVSGLYGDHVVSVINPPERSNEYSWDFKNYLSYGVLTHELAHARQHAVAIVHGGSSTNDWGNTPEGKAYEEAWKKDLSEVPRKKWIGTLDKNEYYTDLLENAAQFCSYYWKVGNEWSYEVTSGGGIQARAPNRFKWCQKFLNKRKTNKP